MEYQRVFNSRGVFRLVKMTAFFGCLLLCSGPPLHAQTEKFLVPLYMKAEGPYGAVLTTDIRIFNPGDQPVTVWGLECVAKTAVPGYEQLLVPFDTMTIPGRFGSLWSAELWVRNDSSEPVNLFPERCFWIGSEFPCSTRIDIAARTTRRLDVLESASARSPGVLLYVPETHAGDLHFSLRVRDLSRQEHSLGTEIPIARASQLFVGSATILNVPLQPGFRTALRVYSPDLIGASFSVRVFRQSTDELIYEGMYGENLPLDPPSPPLVPVTFDLSGLIEEASKAGATTVRVVIERLFPSEAAFWPLITITNNSTQELTVISAQ